MSAEGCGSNWASSQVLFHDQMCNDKHKEGEVCSHKAMRSLHDRSMVGLHYWNATRDEHKFGQQVGKRNRGFHK